MASDRRSETSFAVVFDGPEIEDGRMPIKDLAPALQSLDDLFVEASTLLHPEHPPVNLKFSAAHRGSLAIDLILEAPEVWEQFVTAFNSDEVNALINFKEVIVGAAGFFWFLKWAAAKRVTSTEHGKSPDLYKVTLEDGRRAEVPADVLALAELSAPREKAKSTVAPLTRSGLDQVSFRPRPQVAVEIADPDLPSFETPEITETTILDQVSEINLTIVSVSFDQGYKWRFTDGERPFTAAIEDEAFVRRVIDGEETFRAGDILRCQMRTVQRQGLGLRTERSILHVERHIPAERQMLLDDPGRPADDDDAAGGDPPLLPAA
jgi:hypothetical protein